MEFLTSRQNSRCHVSEISVAEILGLMDSKFSVDAQRTQNFTIIGVFSSSFFEMAPTIKSITESSSFRAFHWRLHLLRKRLNFHWCDSLIFWPFSFFFWCDKALAVTYHPDKILTILLPSKVRHTKSINKNLSSCRKISFNDFQNFKMTLKYRGIMMVKNPFKI